MPTALDRAKERAERLGITLEEELSRLVSKVLKPFGLSLFSYGVHGSDILHDYLAEYTKLLIEKKPPEAFLISVVKNPEGNYIVRVYQPEQG